MLKKVRNLRALRPGQWARVVVPDFECWKEEGDWREVGPGGIVDACIMPMYAPRYDGRTGPERRARGDLGFEWTYRAAYRRVGLTYVNYCRPGGGWIIPSDLAMNDAVYSRTLWGHDEAAMHREGKGAFLYEPASDDPSLCPGEDCSLYLCDICNEHRMPWSDEDGNLVCDRCELAGLVIEPDCVEHLERAREFARSVGLLDQLHRQLTFLDNQGRGNRRQCRLGRDFAPHSFDFAHFSLPGEGRERKLIYNGGLIYQGPTSPADGSFPSLTVSLAEGKGWFCHT
jgi:hypothetical protein